MYDRKLGILTKNSTWISLNRTRETTGHNTIVSRLTRDLNFTDYFLVKISPLPYIIKHFE